MVTVSPLANDVVEVRLSEVIGLFSEVLSAENVLDSSATELQELLSWPPVPFVPSKSSVPSVSDVLSVPVLPQW